MDADLHRTIAVAGTGASDPPRTIDGWFARRRLRRQLRGGRRGRVEALDDKVLLAPLSDRPCVAWVLEVRRVDVVIPPGQFVTGGRWSLLAGSRLAREEAAIPFALPEHAVVIDPRRAELALVFDHVSWSINPSCESWPKASTGEDPAQRLVRERLGITDGSWLSPPPGLEYREAIVAPGQVVTVAGTASRPVDEPLPSTPYREPAETRWSLAALVISADQNA